MGELVFKLQITYTIRLVIFFSFDSLLDIGLFVALVANKAINYYNNCRFMQCSNDIVAGK